MKTNPKRSASRFRCTPFICGNRGEVRREEENCCRDNE